MLSKNIGIDKSTVVSVAPDFYIHKKNIKNIGLFSLSLSQLKKSYGFPFKAYHYTNINEKFNDLKQLKTNEFIWNNTTKTLKIPDDFYERFDLLSDLIPSVDLTTGQNTFQEEHRMKCSFGNNISLYNYYFNVLDHTEMFKHLLNRESQISQYGMREYLYEKSKSNFVKECNLFKPSLTKYLIERYIGVESNGVVLDLSCGWGDRLIGALSSEKCGTYYGIEPNGVLLPAYNNLKKFNSNTDVLIEQSGCELLNINFTKPIDLIIWSPPFFDLEVYSNDNSQSIVKYKSYDDWLQKFIYHSIEIWLSKLKRNGYFLIYVQDFSTYQNKRKVLYKFYQDVLNYVQKIMKYHYTMNIIGEAGKPRTLIVASKDNFV